MKKLPFLLLAGVTLLTITPYIAPQANAAPTNIVAGVDNLGAWLTKINGAWVDIRTNTANIDIAEADIVTNTGNITTNTVNIATNAADITTLEANAIASNLWTTVRDAATNAVPDDAAYTAFQGQGTTNTADIALLQAETFAPPTFAPSINRKPISSAPLFAGEIYDIMATNDVVGEYRAFGGLVFDAYRDRWVVACFDGTNHASSGSVSIILSDDATGQTWGDVAQIFTAAGTRMFRDVQLWMIGSDVYMSAINYPTSGETEQGYVEIYTSNDGGLSFTQRSVIYPTDSGAGWTRAATTTKPIYFQGEWLIAGFETDVSPTDFRSMLWASDDGMLTWTNKSIINQSIYQPNESIVFPYKGDLVAIVRFDSAPSATESQIRHISTDAGLTWDAGVTGEPSRWAAARPEVYVSPNGRTFMGGRLDTTLGGCLWETTDGGLSWIGPVIPPTTQSMYQAFYPCDDGLLACLNFREDAAGNNDASWGEFMFFDIADRPIKNNDSDVDDLGIVQAWKAPGFGVTNYPAVAGIDGTVDATEDPTIITSGTNTFYGAPATDFGDTVNDMIYFGANTDWTFLSDGSAFTLGVNFKYTEATGLKYILGTFNGGSPSSDIGIMLRISNEQIYSFVYNAAGAGNQVSPDAGNNFGFLKAEYGWHNFTFSCDGSGNYRMENNGVEVFDVAANTNNVAAPEVPLWFGRASGTGGEQVILRSYFISTNYLSGADLYNAKRWLESE